MNTATNAEPTLTSTQEHVLAMIAAGASALAAAKAAGIHRNTVANWLRSSTFHAAWVQARAEQAWYWREQAVALAARALAVIAAILNDPNTPAGVRLKAALAILDRAASSAPPVPDFLHNLAQLPLSEPAAAVDSPEIGAPPPNSMHKSAQVAPSDTADANEGREITPAPPISVHKNAQAPAEPATAPQTIRRQGPKIGRNEPCPCGSGKKFKRCCLPNVPGLATAA